MSTFILMKLIESVTSRYDRGIRSLTPGNLDIGDIIPPPKKNTIRKFKLNFLGKHSIKGEKV